MIKDLLNDIDVRHTHLLDSMHHAQSALIRDLFTNPPQSIQSAPTGTAIVNAPSSSLPTKIKSYSGADPKEDVAVFFAKYETYAVHAKLNEGDKLDRLPLFLDGLAASFYHSIRPTTQTYPEAKAALIRTFAPDQLTSLNQLRACTQGKDTVNAYFTRFVTLSTRVPDNLMSQTERVLCFITGLGDVGDLVGARVSPTASTLQHAYTAAIEIEQTLNLRKPLSRAVNVHAVVGHRDNDEQSVCDTSAHVQVNAAQIGPTAVSACASSKQVEELEKRLASRFEKLASQLGQLKSNPPPRATPQRQPPAAQSERKMYYCERHGNGFHSTDRCRTLAAERALAPTFTPPAQHESKYYSAPPEQQQQQQTQPLLQQQPVNAPAISTITPTPSTTFATTRQPSTNFGSGQASNAGRTPGF